MVTIEIKCTRGAEFLRSGCSRTQTRSTPSLSCIQGDQGQIVLETLRARVAKNFIFFFWKFSFFSLVQWSLSRAILRARGRTATNFVLFFLWFREARNSDTSASSLYIIAEKWPVLFRKLLRNWIFGICFCVLIFLDFVSVFWIFWILFLCTEFFGFCFCVLIFWIMFLCTDFLDFVSQAGETPC